jgi:hypothetical protein
MMGAAGQEAKRECLRIEEKKRNYCLEEKEEKEL